MKTEWKYEQYSQQTLLINGKGKAGSLPLITQLDRSDYADIIWRNETNQYSWNDSDLLKSASFARSNESRSFFNQLLSLHLCLLQLPFSFWPLIILLYIIWALNISDYILQKLRIYIQAGWT